MKRYPIYFRARRFTKMCFILFQLTRETTDVLIEVAGQSDDVCKSIIRALIGWLLHHARPKGDGDSLHPLTICPLTIVNSETRDRFARYPTSSDISDPDFLCVKI